MRVILSIPEHDLLSIEHSKSHTLCNNFGLELKLDPITDYNVQLWQRAELMEILRSQEQKKAQEGIEEQIDFVNKEIDFIKKDIVQSLEKQASAVSSTNNYFPIIINTFIIIIK